MESTQVEAVRGMTNKEMVLAIIALQEAVAALQATAGAPRNEAQREMTDADCVRILSGDLKDLKHGVAAKQLGLSYGQVYSARLEFTFKHIHKAMKAEGVKNAWAKA